MCNIVNNDSSNRVRFGIFPSFLLTLPDLSIFHYCCVQRGSDARRSSHAVFHQDFSTKRENSVTTLRQRQRKQNMWQLCVKNSSTRSTWRCLICVQVLFIDCSSFIKVRLYTGVVSIDLDHNKNETAPLTDL